ncbi:leucyl-tRNA synthetase [Ignisphaera aggregans DSM 17230]|uniref:Leucine--tRNA ligase n=1 Tax=Ignisphaera aggregans (strain DSM 17230 / JCM 13409 / AQ1.S1) TaxID=583356 RepID=E0SP91_IGNAA|nr:leucyl-tRNA synthetase [Ignisphaera aggregans DSM 17230]
MSSENINEWFVELAKKWSRILESERIFEADVDEFKSKYFITAAFMYPNGPIHIGHGRTYLIADIIARFKRLQGYNVLFPMGFHYTGTPIIAMAEAISEGDKDLIELFRDTYGVPSDEIDRMKDPLYLARYFHRVSKDVMKLYGLSIDWRREFTTIDPEFKSFIHWQFRKLYEKGYIEKGTHPVGWCPRHEMPVGMHDTKGDVEPEIGEFIAIYFKDDNGVIYPTATLRPETIFGVTNIWVNPKAMYAKIKLDNGDIWIVGEGAYHRLKYQLRFNLIELIEGEKLVGRIVRNPITGEHVSILPANFVDDSFATGIVMSVPAHAPYDAIALEEIKRDPKYSMYAGSIEPRIIIEINGVKKALAYEIIENMKIKSQEDKEKLDEATRYVYTTELQRGIMLRDLHLIVPMASEDIKRFVSENISGKSVSYSRDIIRRYLIENKMGMIIYELINKPVYCRCGTEIVVKVLEDQWFIDYGNQAWKEKAREALNNMIIVPEEARAQFEATIDWLRRRACARTRGLGVPLPWDNRWIIESLSDSTIYMAFYTVIHKIRKYSIPIDKLNDRFWDYVMLGEGNLMKISNELSLPPEALEDLHKEFSYWYPLDLRVSGKDLIPNHLTFFIFNHVAIYPKAFYPRGIIANGWVLIKQQKMSKSARNIIPLKNLIEEYGSDIVRLLLALGAEVYQDENIDPDLLKRLCRNEYPYQLKFIYDTIVRLYSERDSFRDETTILDLWFWNEFLRKVNTVIELANNFRLREAGIIIYYDITDLIKKYLGLVSKPSKILIEVFRIWIPLISVYTPFIAEETWSKTFAIGRVSKYTIEIPRNIDERIILAFMYADHVINFVENIIRATKKSTLNRMVIYVAKRDMQDLMRRIIRGLKNGLRISEIIELVSKELGMEKRVVSQLIRPMYDVAISTPDNIKELYIKYDDLDEMSMLNMAKEYISKVLNVRIEIYSAEDITAPDYGGKKKASLPLRPGIYIE